MESDRRRRARAAGLAPALACTVAHAAVVAAAVASWGCGTIWQRPEDDLAPRTLAERQVAQVWHGDRAERWHAVRVAADSISGVPFFRPPGCDSCRVALSRDVVDSLRLGDPIDDVAVPVGIALLLTLAALALHGGFGGPGS